LQSENKGLREMLELEKRNKNNASESLEKRVRELISNEAKIKQRLEEYKTNYSSREDQ
jgi:hypothetical protein